MVVSLDGYGSGDWAMIGVCISGRALIGATGYMGELVGRIMVYQG